MLYETASAPSARPVATLEDYLHALRRRKLLVIACVVLAVTPDTLESLREESAALLDEIEEQKTLLPSEDVAMLRRRLVKSRPIEVHRLTKADLELLAERARKAHASARGATKDPEFDAFVRQTIARSSSPRAVLRAVVGRLERLHFSE